MDKAVMTNSTAPAARRGFKGVAAGMVLAVSATLALSAGAAAGPRHSHGAAGGPGMFMGSPEHVSRAVDRMLDQVNASDSQRAQIKQIVQQAATDLKSQRDARRALHEKSLQIFTAPTVDAAAAESVRQQMLAQHDAASRRMLTAMLDVSRVLTPEQRSKLAQQMQQHHQRMQERMREHAHQAPAKQ